VLVVRAPIVGHHDAEATVAEGLDCLAELGCLVTKGIILDPFVVKVLSLNLLADHLLVLWHFDRCVYAKKGGFFIFNFTRHLVIHLPD
jgi:hypothetical protein